MLAPQTISEKQRAEIRLRNWKRIWLVSSQYFQGKVVLTVESVLEASAKSSPGLVVIAVLELGLGSSSSRGVLVVPLAPVVSGLRLLLAYSFFSHRRYLQDK